MIQINKIIASLLFILILNNLFGQIGNWHTYKLDSVVSIDLPGEVFEFDTVEKDMVMNQIFSVVNNSNFIVQRTQMVKDHLKATSNELPYNIESLYKHYNDYSDELKDLMPYPFHRVDTIKNGEYLGFYLSFVDSVGQSTLDVQYFILNNYLYSFMYKNTEDFHIGERLCFFNSISITSSNNTQYLGKSTSIIAKWAAKLTFVFLFIIAAIAIIRLLK